ncbi:DMT family transporter [Streptosporangium sp. NPDC005286]|uniref:DMT family transporter n=1 Tax=Streptosporangium sp. NPDC005286 TaxID=3154463 RepID=UPI0033A8B1A8
MTAAILAVLTAACNALSSVLQRQAARTAPQSRVFKLALIGYLIRQPSWLGGMGALIGGFLLQAAALNFGALALVQPILVTELPFTMILVSLILHVHLDRGSWLAIGILTIGLAVFLISADPGQSGTRSPTMDLWLITVVVTVGVAAGLIAMAKIRSGPSRGALLGITSALGFAFTAALIKENTEIFAAEDAAVLTSWSLYAMIAAGLFSVFVLQSALSSASLVVVQPTLNIADPVVSIMYGVALFGENIRLGWWVVPELVGVGLIFYGSVRLSRSPLVG